MTHFVGTEIQNLTIDDVDVRSDVRIYSEYIEEYVVRDRSQNNANTVQ
jgi:hypothetical protein